MDYSGSPRGGIENGEAMQGPGDVGMLSHRKEAVGWSAVKG